MTQEYTNGTGLFSGDSYARGGPSTLDLAPSDGPRSRLPDSTRTQHPSAFYAKNVATRQPWRSRARSPQEAGQRHAMNGLLSVMRSTTDRSPFTMHGSLRRSSRCRRQFSGDSFSACLGSASLVSARISRDCESLPWLRRGRRSRCAASTGSSGRFAGCPEFRQIRFLASVGSQ